MPGCPKPPLAISYTRTCYFWHMPWALRVIWSSAEPMSTKSTIFLVQQISHPQILSLSTSKDCITALAGISSILQAVTASNHSGRYSKSASFYQGKIRPLYRSDWRCSHRSQQPHSFHILTDKGTLLPSRFPIPHPSHWITRMGYTHYWTNVTDLPPLQPETMERIHLILAKDDDILCGLGQEGRPLVTADRVSFNGQGEAGLKISTGIVLKHGTFARRPGETTTM